MRKEPLWRDKYRQTNLKLKGIENHQRHHRSQLRNSQPMPDRQSTVANIRPSSPTQAPHSKRASTKCLPRRSCPKTRASETKASTPSARNPPKPFGDQLKTTKWKSNWPHQTSLLAKTRPSLSRPRRLWVRFSKDRKRIPSAKAQNTPRSRVGPTRTTLSMKRKRKKRWSTCRLWLKSLLRRRRAILRRPMRLRLRSRKRPKFCSRRRSQSGLRLKSGSRSQSHLSMSRAKSPL